MLGPPQGATDQKVLNEITLILQGAQKALLLLKETLVTTELAFSALPLFVVPRLVRRAAPPASLCGAHSKELACRLYRTTYSTTCCRPHSKRGSSRSRTLLSS